MSTWIPALHAGMTELAASSLTERNSFTHIFKREITKDTKKEFSRKGAKTPSQT